MRPLAALAVLPLALAPLAVTGISAARANDGPAARWHTQGRWLVDETGRVVITHGINEVEKNAPYAPDAIGFDDDDAAFLAAQGFTSVRLGVPWTGVEPQAGRYDDAYLDRIAETVRTLHRHGIASLLDAHQDMANPRFQGNGWPDWAILDNGMPNVVKAGFPGNYFLNEGLKYTYDNFLTNRPAADGVGLADHYAAAWAHVAERMRTVPGVMGFDLYNEPFPGHGNSGCLNLLWGCPVEDARLSQVQQKAVDAIRAVDTATTVYYEPQQLFNIAAPTNVKVNGTNLALSFHDYCTAQATLHSYFGCSVPDAAVFRNAQNHSRDRGVGLLLTEFGATTAQDVLRAQVDLAATNLVGWQYWAYTGGDPTTAGPGKEQALVFDPHLPPTGDNVDHAKLDAVAVVHPDRVAGTPTAYRYDRDARRFTMTWTATTPDGSTAPADAQTTVVVPEHLGTDYTVTATGARVVSEPGASVVRLVRDAAASTATLTLTLR